MFSTALDVRHYAFHKSHTQEVLHEKKRKLQTLPSAKEQLILSSSSPGSLVSLWHPRGVIWTGISSKGWGSSFSRFPRGSRSWGGQKCSPASSVHMGQPKSLLKQLILLTSVCVCECVRGFGHFPLSHTPLQHCLLFFPFSLVIIILNSPPFPQFSTP